MWRGRDGCICHHRQGNATASDSDRVEEKRTKGGRSPHSLSHTPNAFFMNVHKDNVRLHARASLASVAFPSLARDELNHTSELFVGSMHCMPRAIVLVRIDCYARSAEFHRPTEGFEFSWEERGCLSILSHQHWSQFAHNIHPSNTRTHSDKTRMVCPIGAVERTTYARTFHASHCHAVCISLPSVLRCT